MGSRSVKQIHSMDTWRLFASFLVICVHFPLSGMAGGIAITYAKTAVPFFIIVSGYFCYRDDRREFGKRLGKQILKLSMLGVLANLLFFLISYKLSGASSLTIYKILCLEPSAWKDFWLVNQSPFADHLWFLGSMVYAMLLVLIFTGFNIHEYVFFISPLLLGVYIFMSRSGEYNFIYCRNALFCTMPYFMYGCLIRKYETKIMKKLKGPVIVAIFTILVLLTFLEFWHYQDVNITFIGPEFLVIFLVLLLLKYQNLGKNTIIEWLGRRDTLFIYIMHYILVIYFYTKYSSYMPVIVERFGTLIIFVSALICAELLQLVKSMVKKLNHKNPIRPNS